MTVTTGPWSLTPSLLSVFGNLYYRRKVSSSRSPNTFAYEYSDGADFGLVELRQAWFPRR